MTFFGELLLLLAIGCRRFAAETGVLGQVIDNKFEILKVSSPDKH